MKTEFHTIQEIIDRKMETPLDISDIPNHMGINLCSVEALSWTRQDDGQLVSLSIHFLPETEREKASRTKKARRVGKRHKHDSSRQRRRNNR